MLVCMEEPSNQDYFQVKVKKMFLVLPVNVEALIGETNLSKLLKLQVSLTTTAHTLMQGYFYYLDANMHFYRPKFKTFTLHLIRTKSNEQIKGIRK